MTKNIVYKRLKDAFPDMQIKNTSAILKEKIEQQRINLLKQKEKLLKKKQELIDESKLLKELNKKKKTK